MTLWCSGRLNRLTLLQIAFRSCERPCLVFHVGTLRWTDEAAALRGVTERVCWSSSNSRNFFRAPKETLQHLPGMARFYAVCSNVICRDFFGLCMRIPIVWSGVRKNNLRSSVSGQHLRKMF